MSHHRPGQALVLVGLVLFGLAARSDVREPPRPIPRLAYVVAAAQAAAAGELDATDAYRVALLKMKAHLDVARALMRQGVPGAHYHLREPLREAYKELASELEQRNATLTRDIVEQLASAAEGGSDLLILSALETASTAIENSLVRTGRMNTRSMLEISRALFRDAVEQYRQAVSEHTVVDTHKYQNGAGYVAVADAVTRRVRGSAGDSGTYQQLRKAVALLREAWPAVIAPAIANGPDTVAAWLADVESALDALDG